MQCLRGLVAAAPDRNFLPALAGTLLALTGMMVLFVGLLGSAAFATVPPLQLWVLQQAAGARSLALSLNIGAFNPGNAFGAWLGWVAIQHGPGLEALPWIAALVPLFALLVAG